MSTRSLIGKVNADNTITFIYCHWDGYPSHNGKILNEHYDEAKLDKLLDLGNVSSLGNDIGEKHDFNACIKEMTTFYGRDRGEEDCDSVTVDNLENFLADFKESWAEYAYLWQKNMWTIYLNGDFVSLKNVLEQEKCN